MQVPKRLGRLSYVFLYITPFLVFTVGAVRALRIPGVYQVLAGVQFAAVALAAWQVGAWAITVEGGARRQCALAGTLLILPWLFFALLAGIGLPSQATPPENRLRYGILLLDGVAIAGGLVLLTDVLRQAGERFYSTIGFAAAVLAGPLGVLWAVFPLALGDVVAQVRATAGQIPDWLKSLQGLSEILLMGIIFLTYVASAAFSKALGRTQWLGRSASRGFTYVSLLAILGVAIMMMVALRTPQDPMAAFKTWYALPGFIFSIPAVSFMIPSLLGVSLLKRAGATDGADAGTSRAT